jgi:hypothetical protein
MTRIVQRLFAATVVVTAVACGEASTGLQQQAAFDAAFATIPVGFDQATTTFGSGGAAPGPWMPGDRGGDDVRRLGALMGGGLGDLFLGGGFGPGFGHGRFGDDDEFDRDGILATCTFNAATGRVECAPVTRNGLTIVRSAAYTDAAGKVQSAFNESTTNTINTQVKVTGTVTRRDSATSVVDAASDRTVSGLLKTATQRTVNGTSTGKETTTGTNSKGKFTAVRTAGDTTKGLVIPVSSGDRASTSAASDGQGPDGNKTFPTAGTIIREMKAVVTYEGQAPTTKSRREVITYDGTNTAKVVITQDGTTKNCTLPLPRGKPTCQ